MKNLYGKKYYRLDYKQLVRQFVGHNEKIVKVEYFTAYFFPDKNWENRHKAYVRALNNKWTHTVIWKFQEVTRRYIKRNNKIEMFIYNNFIKKLPDSWQGYFLPDRLEYKNYEEKRTDVNVALNILEDWLLDVYDKAFVVSWDSDISPAIVSVKKHFKNKTFVLLKLPWEKAHTMSKVCDEIKEINESNLKVSLLPQKVGNVCKPKTWK